MRKAFFIQRCTDRCTFDIFKMIGFVIIWLMTLSINPLTKFGIKFLVQQLYRDKGDQ